MALSLLQAIGNAQSVNATTTAQLTAPPTAGNLLVAATSTYSSAAALAMDASWTLIASGTTATAPARAVSLWYKIAAASETGSYTASGGTAGVYQELMIAEFATNAAKIPNPGAFLGGALQFDASAVSLATPSQKPTLPTEQLVVCFLDVPNAPSSTTWAVPTVNTTPATVAVDDATNKALTSDPLSGTLFYVAVTPVGNAYQGSASPTPQNAGAGAIAVFTATIRPRKPAAVAVVPLVRASSW